MLREVDFPETALADQASEGVVAYAVEVGGGELAQKRLVGVGEL